MPSLNDYMYDLPKELIAQQPSHLREESRLLVYHVNEREVEHRTFRDITEYLEKGDMVVVNNTKVLKTRLVGRKATGGRAAITIVAPLGNRRYDVFVRCKNPNIGTELLFQEGLVGRIVESGIEGERFIIEFNYSDEKVKEIIEKHGDYTLPGYIKNYDYDRKRYQTVFAKREGSIAAPTAGLHFSKELIARLKEKGVEFAEVCLHVGIGTFQPITENDYTKHKMHSERVVVDEATARAVNRRRGRLILVGTTTLRALETATDQNGIVHPYNGDTNLFIYPGYRFKLKFDGLITNFHLPGSTLILLVAAIIGDDWKRVYEEAISKRYRFYSFGDAMFIKKH